MPTAEWDVYIVNEVREWINQLDEPVHARVVHAIDALAAGGPGLGRPLVDTIAGAKIQNLKELRPGTVRIVRVRSMALKHSAGRRRQVRTMAHVVRGGDPTGRTTV